MANKFDESNEPLVNNGKYLPAHPSAPTATAPPPSYEDAMNTHFEKPLNNQPIVTPPTHANVIYQTTVIQSPQEAVRNNENNLDKVECCMDGLLCCTECFVLLAKCFSDD